MKIKILSVLIILSSLVSWIIWSYVFLYFMSPKLNNVVTNTITKEIIKDRKNITITELQSEVTKLVNSVGPSVVNIIIKKDIDLYRRDPWGFFEEKIWSVEKQIWGWSGFFVTKDGVIMTNKHVVADTKAKYTVVTNDGKEFDASVVALDPLTDLAIIKIDSPIKKDFNVLNIIEDEKYINIGQFVIAIWNALWEFQNSVSFWVISWKNRSIVASWNNLWTEKLTWLLQTDAAINPGNSWWPLLNLNWEIIGINTAIAGNGQWLGFSIPLSKKRIEYILKSIEKYWNIKRPFIWISYLPINDAIAQEIWLKVNYWAYIPKENWSIVSWSTAEKSGIKPGDIILEIDWIKISYENTIASIIQNKIPGDTINMKILNENGEEKIINLKLWEY